MGKKHKAAAADDDGAAAEAGTQEEEGGRKHGRFKLVALIVGAGVAVAAVLKRKRDQELDEALWEEPRSL